MERNLVFEIVIVYENFAAGVRAKWILDRLSAALKPTVEVHSGLWKFDWLGHPRLREQAAEDASKADMIVVSTRGDSDIPAHVKDWVESWLPQKRRDGLAALVALLDQPPQTNDSSWPAYAYLLRVAGEGKMDFFCRTSDREQPADYTVEIAHRRSERVSRPLAAVLDQDTAWRGWGINA